jgi:hypothetical protein
MLAVESEGGCGACLVLVPLLASAAAIWAKRASSEIPLLVFDGLESGLLVGFWGLFVGLVVRSVVAEAVAAVTAESCLGVAAACTDRPGAAKLLGSLCGVILLQWVPFDWKGSSRWPRGCWVGRRIGCRGVVNKGGVSVRGGSSSAFASPLVVVGSSCGASLALGRLLSSSV